MPVNPLLLEGLLTAGIIQFGHFVDPNGETTPLRLQFELLPAYPHLLNLAAEAVSHHLSGQALERLVCGQDGLPLAVCVGQKTSIPLIHNQNDGLAGAYDVGHPAALIANVYAPQTSLSLDIVRSRAKRTGLEIITQVYLIGLSEPESPTALCLIVMNEELLSQWVQQRWITTPQREALEQWLKQQMTTTTRHPG